MKKATLYSYVGLILAFALVIVLCIGSSGFRNWNVKTWFKGTEQNTVLPNDPNNPNKPNSPDEDNSANLKDSNDGNAVISDTSNNGITLASVKLPYSAYAANGISTQSDTAFLLTASVQPDTATNTAVDWSVEWIDGNNGFASGKNVTDYVTVNPTTNGSLKANLVCRQAFGSQIKVVAVSRDNPSATAQCTVDYVQKVDNVSLSFGNLECNLGGTTNVKYNINPNGIGPGGNVNVQYNSSSVYTIQDSFSATVRYTPPTTERLLKLADGHPTGDYFGFENTTYGNITFLYLDYSHTIFNWYYLGRVNDKMFRDQTTDWIASQFSNIQEPSLGSFCVDIKGSRGTYTYSTDFVCTGCINYAGVTSLSISNGNIEF